MSILLANHFRLKYFHPNGNFITIEKINVQLYITKKKSPTQSHNSPVEKITFNFISHIYFMLRNASKIICLCILHL